MTLDGVEIFSRMIEPEKKFWDRILYQYTKIWDTAVRGNAGLVKGDQIGGSMKPQLGDVDLGFISSVYNFVYEYEY